MKMVGLLDCNNFYVSCERVFDPLLDGKPVAVLSNNDGSCISRSNEFKALNLPKRLCYYAIKKQAPQLGLVFRSSNYPLYGDMSRRVMNILADKTPSIEQYSIDESFFYTDFSPDTDLAAYGRMIRRKILKWTGIPCGIGFAKTKTLAKIANHIGKKTSGGVFVMPEDGELILKKLPVTEVWGIAWKLAEKLKRLSVYTAWDLACQDPAVIRKEFNVLLAQTVFELQGISCISFDSEVHHSKRLAFSRSFNAPTTDVNAIREAILHYTANIGRKLRWEGQRSACGVVYLNYVPEYHPLELSGGYTSKFVTFQQPTADSIEIGRQLAETLPSLWLRDRRCIKAGVILFGLEAADQRQNDFFTDTRPTDKREKLCSIMDQINQKYGRNSVYSLGEGIEKKWSMKQELLSKRYTTQWNELLEVK